MRRVLIGLLVGTAAIGGGNAATADAARPVCRDSNGSAPGGSVYVRYGDRLPCDVRPPQRLHVVRTPNRAACDHMGGRLANGVCWDVDY